MFVAGHTGEEDWPEDASRDRLIADWWMYQRRGGHRTGTDDFLTAWFAVMQAQAPVRHYLDLGCGVGSVLLMTANALQPARSLGMEAQSQSVLLAQRSVRELPMNAPCIEVIRGDIRRLTLEAGRFDLVTGSPPYFPLDAGVLPNDEQRRACRFEVRGGVEVYCDAAAHALSTDGTFVLVFQTRWDERVIQAAQAAALHLVARADVHMRVDHAEPFLTVYAFRRAPEPLRRTDLCVRQADGEWTSAYRAARRAVGY